MRTDQANRMLTKVLDQSGSKFHAKKVRPLTVKIISVLFMLLVEG